LLVNIGMRNRVVILLYLVSVSADVNKARASDGAGEAQGSVAGAWHRCRAVSSLLLQSQAAAPIPGWWSSASGAHLAMQTTILTVSKPSRSQPAGVGDCGMACSWRSYHGDSHREQHTLNGELVTMVKSTEEQLLLYGTMLFCYSKQCSSPSLNDAQQPCQPVFWASCQPYSCGHADMQVDKIA
jgi:hypothetical protein